MEYTEEEKKAFETLEYFEPDDLVECSIYLKSIKTIKKLIEKQQKEIEEKDKRIFYLENEARKIIEQSIDKEKINIYINYISKDKIREKIDDLQRYKGLVMYEKYNYDAIIRHLKELLGE